METILGIDLGTTNSVVSIIRDGAVQVLEEDGQKIMPSVVGLDGQGKLLVGWPARNQATLAPDRAVRSIKRKMGTAELVPLGDHSYAPQEISAIILRTLKQRAERQLGREIRKAVITVPAFFNEQQREATREAGQLAGLEVVRIINEPTAASLTYNSRSDGLERLLVYDLGGGTFDVSVVQIEQGVVEVLSSHGNTRLGGDDFDQLLLEFVCDKFKDEHDVDLRDSLASRARVLRGVEEAKKQLSFDAIVTIEEEFITEQDNIPLHLRMEISRLDYEPLIEALLSQTLVCVDEALSDAKLTAKQIDRVLLVGGASRTPMVHRLLQERLDRPLHAEVDPDLCVSMGAAIQGGMIVGAEIGPVLVDITPHTMGIQCVGEVRGFDSVHCFAPLIERNTALPASRSEIFGTLVDGQEEVKICVYQGEDQDVRHNELVGEFTLQGLADVSRGNQILVRFDLDLDGILTITATERATGLEQRLSIDNAMSRFRSLNRDDAKARLAAAFSGDDSYGVQSASSQQSMASQCAAVNRSLELQQAIANADALIDKSARIASESSADDAEEIQLLVEQLRAAIAAESLKEIQRAATALDDIVFYLQDA